MKLLRLGMILLLILPGAAGAQNAIPAGTILPLQLNTGLNGKKAKPGQEIRARVMQNIPGTAIHRGDHVIGHVLAAAPQRLTLRFDAVISDRGRAAVTTSLRALASMLEVEEAQIPEGGPDRSLPPEWRNTQQIGGETVYRGGGPVASGTETVGEPTPWGVLARPRPAGACRGEVAGNDAPQALWIFSTNACGLYGFDGLRIEDAGRTNPAGTIELKAVSGPLNIRGGSGLLLRVR